MNRLRRFIVLFAALSRKENGASSFTSVASRANDGYGHTRHSSRLWSDGGHDSHTSSVEQGSPTGHIVSIECCNIAGMSSGGETRGIRVDFGRDACLVAVTGESGSGKSLLISKAIDLVTGGKAIASLVPSQSSGESDEQLDSSSVELSEYFVHKVSY